MGSPGMSRVQVWVDCTRSPLGSRAMIGVDVGALFVMGAGRIAGEEVACGARVEDCPFLDCGRVGGDGLEQGGGVSIVVGGGQARSRIKINIVVYFSSIVVRP